MGDYAARELKLKRVATISDDFAFGHEQMSAFQRVFEDAGGKVVKKLWPPHAGLHTLHRPDRQRRRRVPRFRRIQPREVHARLSPALEIRNVALSLDIERCPARSPGQLRAPRSSALPDR
jgi:hypothetical protein